MLKLLIREYAQQEEGGSANMNLIRDLKKQIEDKRKQESMVAQLRKRSKESIARPKAEKNITSNDPRLQGI